MKASGGLVEIDRRRPSGRFDAREPLHAFLEREQVAQRIPARESHEENRSMFEGSAGSVVPSQGSAPRQCPQPMATIQATKLRKGMLFKLDKDLFRALDVQHVTPGNLRGFVRVKARNIRSGTLADNKLRSEDLVERATLDERAMAVIYNDGTDYYFMDTDTFEQTHISSEALGDSVNYLLAEMVIQVGFYGSEPVGIELPQTVDLVVEETTPAIKGATASAQLKPATLETGLVVQVPPFVNTGDKIRVSTDTGDALGPRLSTCGGGASARARVPHRACRWTSSARSRTRAGSKSSPAACSAARAKS